MQIVLLFVIFVLSVILFRLLSSQKITYPYIRTTRLIRKDGNEFATTESEMGLLTIDQNFVIVDGEEYHLKQQPDGEVEAILNIDNNRLLSVCIYLEDGEQLFIIDPEHNQVNASLFPSRQQPSASVLLSV